MPLLTFIQHAVMAVISLSIIAFTLAVLLLPYKPQKPTGIYMEFAGLFDRIKHCTHPAELSFLEGECFQFEADHRGSKDCAELFSELMQEILRKEGEVKRMRMV